MHNNVCFETSLTTFFIHQLVALSIIQLFCKFLRFYGSLQIYGQQRWVLWSLSAVFCKIVFPRICRDSRIAFWRDMCCSFVFTVQNKNVFQIACNMNILVQHTFQSVPQTKTIGHIIVWAGSTDSKNRDFRLLILMVPMNLRESCRRNPVSMMTRLANDERAH